MTGNLSASILARLLTLAKQRGDDYNLLLNRFGMERLLARVSTSPHADRFLLKGALLFALWYDTPHRPTRDADLLGFGPDDEANLIATFRDIAAMDLGDGIVFDPDSVKADAIREDNTYGGTRITLVARIGSARCALQIDVGFGDAVTPGPQTVAYPTLLGDFPAPTLRVSVLRRPFPRRTNQAWRYSFRSCRLFESADRSSDPTKDGFATQETGADFHLSRSSVCWF
jgi:hypothetical protein